MTLSSMTGFARVPRRASRLAGGIGKFEASTRRTVSMCACAFRRGSTDLRPGPYLSDGTLCARKHFRVLTLDETIRCGARCKITPSSLLSKLYRDSGVAQRQGRRIAARRSTAILALRGVLEPRPRSFRKLISGHATPAVLGSLAECVRRIEHRQARRRRAPSTPCSRHPN